MKLFGFILWWVIHRKNDLFLNVFNYLIRVFFFELIEFNTIYSTIIIKVKKTTKNTNNIQ